jgi:endonuclease G
VLCPHGTADRTGMTFYTCDSVVTSTNADYLNNSYDKGHMAPAEDFSCSEDTMRQTFTYLNCSLQEQNLNRTLWRSLELHERELAKNNRVNVTIECMYSRKSKRLKSGAIAPDSYRKTIEYNGHREVYVVKNEKPKSTDYVKYRIENK